MRQVTLREAAKILDISEGAVRKRYERGSLEGETGEDSRIYVWVDDVYPSYTPDSRLIERLEGEVEYLREQLEAEREAHRESRRIIGGLVQRMPELEAATSDTMSDDSQTIGRPSDSHVSNSQSENPQRKSWWRKFFA